MATVTLFGIDYTIDDKDEAFFEVLKRLEEDLEQLTRELRKLVNK